MACIGCSDGENRSFPAHPACSAPPVYLPEVPPCLPTRSTPLPVYQKCPPAYLPEVPPCLPTRSAPLPTYQECPPAYLPGVSPCLPTTSVPCLPTRSALLRIHAARAALVSVPAPIRARLREPHLSTPLHMAPTGAAGSLVWGQVVRGGQVGRHCDCHVCGWCSLCACEVSR